MIKKIKQEKNESNFDSSYNSKGFEENKFRQALNNKNMKYEEEKNSWNSPNSKNLTPSGIHKNITSTQNDNSFLNFLENNSFVKLNRKNLNKEKPQKELVIPIISQVTNIKKELILNDNFLVLNYEKINDLDLGKIKIYKFLFI